MSDIIDFDKKIHVAKPTKHYIYGLVLTLVVVFGIFLVNDYTHRGVSTTVPNINESSGHYQSNFLSFDDFYLNNLEGDKYRIHSFSVVKDNCTALLLITDNQEAFVKIFTFVQNFSSLFYNNGYFYSFIGCQKNESIELSKDIYPLIGDFESLHQYLNNNYVILEERKELYMFKKRILLIERNYLYGNISVVLNPVDIDNRTFYSYGKDLFLIKEKNFLGFRNFYNLPEQEFYDNVKNTVGELSL